MTHLVFIGELVLVGAILFAENRTGHTQKPIQNIDYHFFLCYCFFGQLEQTLGCGF